MENLFHLTPIEHIENNLNCYLNMKVTEDINNMICYLNNSKVVKIYN